MQRYDQTLVHDGHRTLWVAHPHGVVTVTGMFGAAIYGTQPMLPNPWNVRVAVARIIFWLPVLREIALLGGCIAASYEAIHENLQQQCDIFVLPGAMLEQAYADRQMLEVVSARRGFARVAIDNQLRVVPVVSLGEHRTFTTFSQLLPLRLRAHKRIGYGFPWLVLGPWRAPVTAVVGRPIDTALAHTSPYLVPTVSNPHEIVLESDDDDVQTPLQPRSTDKTIRRLQRRFYAQWLDLFDAGQVVQGAVAYYREGAQLTQLRRRLRRDNRRSESIDPSPA